MKTVREMFVSLTAMLINHIWASIIEICIEKWRTQSLKKLKFKCPDMRNGTDLRRLPQERDDDYEWKEGQDKTMGLGLCGVVRA